MPNKMYSLEMACKSYPHELFLKFKLSPLYDFDGEALSAIYRVQE